MARNLRTITVKELIEALEGVDGDALVVFTTDYGDHCHTPQALPIKGEIEETTVTESAYSNSGFRIHEDDERDERDDDDDDDERETEKYLVIR